jgi:hypothetical protein
MPQTVASLIERWAQAQPAERANAQLYISELCDALGVDRPRPAGTGYQFELPVRVVARDGTESTNFIDCWYAGHFALEAKDGDAASDALLLRKAFGQVRNYAAHVPGAPPPYLFVLDVAKTLLVWDRWNGDYGGFSAARRIDLRSLGERPQDADFLRAIWTDPASLDPNARALRVTTEIAERLARLAAQLEDRGHAQEEVARFLIRVVFTMFAEDVDLLPPEIYRDLLIEVPIAELSQAMEDLWRAMDTGGRFGGRKLARFNGQFFRNPQALPLTEDDRILLIEAANREWADVEPSIFGTLLVRALDPVERHRLGAEFTPREFVERLVRPTIEEPVRDRWTAVQADAVQQLERGTEPARKKALKAVQQFHEWLYSLQILDPACGSGNFLYVTLHMLKRIEVEVVALENDLRKQGDADFRLFEVHPRQFHGIEIKPWAREIAELTLWIGYHQFWKQNRHVEYPEPILEATETIECRDAVLAWDDIRHDPARDRPDPTPRIPSAVTGELVPDPAATLPYMEYVNARLAEWPRADFIVGNPPYLGQARQREAFGDGYVEALRGAYPDVPNSADLVTYWWYRAAEEVAAGRTLRAGLITTKSIAQGQNRAVIHQAAECGARVMWAIPSHPWVDDVGSAAVQVAMTVIAREPKSAMVLTVDDEARITGSRTTGALNDDLTAHADVASAAGVPLLANEGLASRGFQLIGAGFILTADEANRLIAADSRNAQFVRQYRNGKDLTQRPRGVFVIDFGLMSEDEARGYPQLYDIVRDRVKPERMANNDRSTRTNWWRFGRNREEFRPALAGLARYIATVETSRHRFFEFLTADVAPDNMLVCLALDDAEAMAVLSSHLHVVWALSAGSRLGIGNDPRYNKSRCFDPFPFPLPSPDLRTKLGDKAEQLDAHRNAALARDERVTMTGMYNVVEKLRSGEPLSPKERTIHEIAACGVLRDIHDELDALVAEAYGWPWPMEDEEILERLVALHDERVAEEKAGTVRWLRPEYQIPRFGDQVAAGAGLGIETARAAPVAEAAEPAPWPQTAVEQIAAIKTQLQGAALSTEELIGRFQGSKAALVQRHLDTLTLMGELIRSESGRYGAPS